MVRKSLIIVNDKSVQKGKEIMQKPKFGAISDFLRPLKRSTDQVVSNSSDDENFDDKVIDNLEFDDIIVKFPYKAYECQKVFMSKLIDCFKQKKHGLLESPTGTGKTICLLSAALAYQNHVSNKKCCKNLEISETIDSDDIEGLFNCIDSMQKNDGWIKDTDNTKLPKIWYASRTHNQLKQVISEFKKTYYFKRKSQNNFDFRSIILASRDNFCIHKERKSKSGQLLDQTCRKLTGKRQCWFNIGCDANLAKSDILKNKIFDIEELKIIARRGIIDKKVKPFCPFYFTREQHKKATIIFLPYNYLITKSMRERLDINVKDDIVIIDEAHNIETSSEEATSFEIDLITLKQIQDFIPEIESILDVYPGSESNTSNRLNFTDYKILQEEFMDWLQNFMDISSEVTLNDKGYYNFKVNLFFAKYRISEINKFLDILRKAQLHIEAYAYSKSVEDSETQKFVLIATKIASFQNNLSILVDPQVQSSHQRFCCLIKNDEKKRYSNLDTNLNINGGNRKILFWSFAAHVALYTLLQDCHSLIITSGTLKPIEALSVQLSHDFNEFVLLENEHVIKSNQIFVSVVNKGFSDVVLDLSYENISKNNKVIDEIGLIISSLVENTFGGGILVFFPSYGRLNSMIYRWQQTGLYKKLLEQINLFLEPPEATEVINLIEDFTYIINHLNGKHQNSRNGNKKYRNNKLDLTKNGNKTAMIFAPFRGKISEGISLADDLVRCVVCIGIPYPSIADIKLQFKRFNLNEFPFIYNKQKINGNSWYNTQAFQAINQAAGRVVRHSNDYGAVILLDSRFSSVIKSNNLSNWMIKAMKENNTINPISWIEAKTDLIEFYKSHIRKDKIKSDLLNLDNEKFNIVDNQIKDTSNTKLFKRESAETANILNSNLENNITIKKEKTIIELLKAAVKK